MLILEYHRMCKPMEWRWIPGIITSPGRRQTRYWLNFARKRFFLVCVPISIIDDGDVFLMFLRNNAAPKGLKLAWRLFWQLASMMDNFQVPVLETLVRVTYWWRWWIRVKSTRYVNGTPTSEVTPVSIRYIRPPHHGHTSQYNGHEWMTHILFVHCQSAAPYLR